jgi:CubicO group peptidase (beta-lactamase class C family)
MRQHLSFVLAMGCTSLVRAVEYCPPAGVPLLPLPDLSLAPAFDTKPLTAALDRLNSDSILFNTSSTSYSVTITTTEDTIFEYHWTAPNINTTVGVSEVNGDTVYRIFSVTKLFVVLSALLQQGLDLDDFVWQHVPLLEGSENFENTTLRMLASHLSGAPRDGKFEVKRGPRALPRVIMAVLIPTAGYAFDTSLRGSPDFLQGTLGMPTDITLPNGYPICNSIEFGLCPTRDGKFCDQARSAQEYQLIRRVLDFLKGALISDYVWPTGQTPAYSNYAFVILGYAIESFTGKSLQAVIADSITKPLGLSTATGLQSQDAALMVIPGEVDHFGTTNIGEWNGCVYFELLNVFKERRCDVINHQTSTVNMLTSAHVEPPECLQHPTTSRDSFAVC